MTSPIEALYPVNFRQADVSALETNLQQHNSVLLIGIKRVGISNFLRFFLTHTKVTTVVVDLNDLIERNLFAFWMLTLKRVADEISFGTYPETIKKEARSLFTECIQLRDLFFTIEAVQRLLSLIVNERTSVSLFLIRFDRLADVITPEFFANLQGLKDRVGKLSYVMTSFRPLHELVPKVFTRSSLVLFLHEQYLKPAEDCDMEIMMQTLAKRYDVQLNKEMWAEILRLSGGHAQYMQLALLRLKHEHDLLKKVNTFEKILCADEEVQFLGEELFSNLTTTEQKNLLEIYRSKNIVVPQKYLLDTGFVKAAGKKYEIFCPLFSFYVASRQQPDTKSSEFTKKEHALFAALRSNENKIVEREKIIEAVWPDAVEFGVSDWAIDRLVARLRRKLELAHSTYKIVTVITRGYKLISADNSES